MSEIIHIISNALADMPDSHLKTQLQAYLPQQENAYNSIESSFQLLTSKSHNSENLNYFFNSWSQTNNSAMTVSGLSNRISMLIHKNKPVHNEKSLFKALASLNRITDEDLAVVGRVLHSQLFYDMSTHFCKGDEWLSKKYLSKEAEDFKAWKDHNSLREEDIMIGLLTTMVHEIYTHGEVEVILPMFRKWIADNETLSHRDTAKVLAWIVVHTGPTEKNHFFHAVNSVYSYAEAMNIDVSQYDIKEIIETYLHKKAQVMEVVAKRLQANSLNLTTSNN